MSSRDSLSSDDIKYFERVKPKARLAQNNQFERSAVGSSFSVPLTGGQFSGFQSFSAHNTAPFTGPSLDTHAADNTTVKPNKHFSFKTSFSPEFDGRKSVKFADFFSSKKKKVPNASGPLSKLKVMFHHSFSEAAAKKSQSEGSDSNEPQENKTMSRKRPTKDLSDEESIKGEPLDSCSQTTSPESYAQNNGGGVSSNFSSGIFSEAFSESPSKATTEGPYDLATEISSVYSRNSHATARANQLIPEQVRTSDSKVGKGKRAWSKFRGIFDPKTMVKSKDYKITSPSQLENSGESRDLWRANWSQNPSMDAIVSAETDRIRDQLSQTQFLNNSQSANLSDSSEQPGLEGSRSKMARLRKSVFGEAFGGNNGVCTSDPSRASGSRILSLISSDSSDSTSCYSGSIVLSEHPGDGRLKSRFFEKLSSDSSSNADLSSSTSSEESESASISEGSSESAFSNTDSDNSDSTVTHFIQIRPPVAADNAGTNHMENIDRELYMISGESTQSSEPIRFKTPEWHNNSFGRQKPSLTNSERSMDDGSMCASDIQELSCGETPQDSENIVSSSDFSNSEFVHSEYTPSHSQDSDTNGEFSSMDNSINFRSIRTPRTASSKRENPKDSQINFAEQLEEMNQIFANWSEERKNERTLWSLLELDNVPFCKRFRQEFVAQIDHSVFSDAKARLLCPILKQFTLVLASLPHRTFPDVSENSSTVSTHVQDSAELLLPFTNATLTEKPKLIYPNFIQPMKFNHMFSEKERCTFRTEMNSKVRSCYKKLAVLKVKVTPDHCEDMIEACRGCFKFFEETFATPAKNQMVEYVSHVLEIQSQIMSSFNAVERAGHSYATFLDYLAYVPGTPEYIEDAEDKIAYLSASFTKANATLDNINSPLSNLVSESSDYIAAMVRDAKAASVARAKCLKYYLEFWNMTVGNEEEAGKKLNKRTHIDQFHSTSRFLSDNSSLFSLRTLLGATEELKHSINIVKDVESEFELSIHKMLMDIRRM